MGYPRSVLRPDGKSGDHLLLLGRSNRARALHCRDDLGSKRTLNVPSVHGKAGLENNAFIRAIQLRRDKVPSSACYPFSIPAVRHLDELALHPAVTFLVGENGTGKSTLLEALAVASGLNAEGGSRNFHFTSRPSHSELHEAIRLVRGVRRPRDAYFLRAESYFNVATEIERLDSEGIGPRVIDSYGGVSLHEQSHGESFLTLLRERLGGQGLYLLDEPEAALSPSRQMTALAQVHELVRQGSQFIIATHSPILMAYPHAILYHFSEEGIASMAYTDTEHFRVTRDFLNRHETMLNVLIGELDLPE